MIVKRNRTGRRRENDGTCNEVFLRCVWEFLTRWLAFGNSHVTCCIDELRKLFISDFGRVHEERINIDAVKWASIVHRFVTAADHFGRVKRTHGKLAAGNEYHSFRQQAWR